MKANTALPKFSHPAVIIQGFSKFIRLKIDVSLRRLKNPASSKDEQSIEISVISRQRFSPQNSCAVTFQNRHFLFGGSKQPRQIVELRKVDQIYVDYNLLNFSLNQI